MAITYKDIREYQNKKLLEKLAGKPVLITKDNVKAILLKFREELPKLTYEKPIIGYSILKERKEWQIINK